MQAIKRFDIPGLHAEYRKSLQGPGFKRNYNTARLGFGSIL